MLKRLDILRRKKVLHLIGDVGKRHVPADRHLRGRRDQGGHGNPRSPQRRRIMKVVAEIGRRGYRPRVCRRNGERQARGVRRIAHASDPAGKEMGASALDAPRVPASAAASATPGRSTAERSRRMRCFRRSTIWCGSAFPTMEVPVEKFKIQFARMGEPAYQHGRPRRSRRASLALPRRRDHALRLHDSAVRRRPVLSGGFSRSRKSSTGGAFSSSFPSIRRIRGSGIGSCRSANGTSNELPEYADDFLERRRQKDNAQFRARRGNAGRSRARCGRIFRRTNSSSR